MRPATNSTTTSADAAGFGNWNSAIPFFFGGLALLLGLIATALIILCSYKRSSSSTPSETQEKGKQDLEVKKEEIEPKVVVIMAGDEKPTYLAMPVSCSAQVIMNKFKY